MPNSMPIADTDSPSASRSLPFAVYLRWMLAVPVVLYLLSFAMLRLPGFEAVVGSTFGPAFEYGFTTRNVNADVVIIGDSAATIDLDPVRISRAAGVKTIVLPNTASSLPIVGKIQLERYLRNNKPPRLIVLYVAPWSLDFNNNQQAGYEGVEAMLAYGSAGEIAGFAAHHPLDMLSFPFEFYMSAPRSVGTRVILHKPGLAAVRAAQGHFDPMAGHASMPNSPCLLDKLLTDAHGTSSAEAMERQYTTAQTLTRVYLATIPACENAALVTGRSFTAVGAAPPRVSPPTDFKGDGSFDHLMPPAVPQASDWLAQSIRDYLKLNAPTAGS